MSGLVIRWNGEGLSRYVLGTAQLGSDYGIANNEGMPDQEKANGIVKVAWEEGVRVFDTAQAYGKSELVLGKALQRNSFSEKARIITKLTPEKNPEDPSWVVPAVQNSCNALGVNQLWGLMLHRFEWLRYMDRSFGETLRNLKKHGLVKYIGVSVYTHTETIDALNHPDIDIIQAPCNIWSPELLTEGIFERAAKENTLIFVRSLFLQGLLLMSPDEVEQRLPKATEVLREWNQIQEDFDENGWELCMRFAATLPVPVVMGAENQMQVNENAGFLHAEPFTKTEIEHIHIRLAPYLSDQITNPAKW